MGGRPVIVAGDQRQTLPITPQNSAAAAVASDIKRNPLWQNFKVFKLTAPMRGALDPDYCARVDSIGNGVGEGPRSADDRGDDHDVYVPDGVRVIHGDDDDGLQQLCDFVHPRLHLGAEYTAEASRCALTSPYNATVDELNMRCLARVPGDPVHLDATHIIPEDCSGADIPALVTEEYLASVRGKGAAAARITLKTGCLVVCLRNMLLELGIMNGSLLKVISISDYLLEVETITDDPADTRRAFLPRILFEVTTGTLKYQRRQFPVRLAYARSNNKLQGATIIRLGVDARFSIFAHGQLYVVLSRVRDRQSIVIYGLPAPPDGERDTLRNIVYKSVLDPSILPPAEGYDAVWRQRYAGRTIPFAGLAAADAETESSSDSGECSCSKSALRERRASPRRPPLQSRVTWVPSGAELAPQLQEPPA